MRAVDWVPKKDIIIYLNVNVLSYFIKNETFDQSNNIKYIIISYIRIMYAFGISEWLNEFLSH